MKLNSLLQKKLRHPDLNANQAAQVLKTTQSLKTTRASQAKQSKQTPLQKPQQIAQDEFVIKACMFFVQFHDLIHSQVANLVLEKTILQTLLHSVAEHVKNDRQKTFYQLMQNLLIKALEQAPNIESETIQKYSALIQQLEAM
jgi:hypothetical protein